MHQVLELQRPLVAEELPVLVLLERRPAEQRERRVVGLVLQHRLEERVQLQERVAERLELQRRVAVCRELRQEPVRLVGLPGLVETE